MNGPSDIPDKEINRLRRRYLLAFGRVMMKERRVDIAVCLSGLMAAYGELISKCSAPGMAVVTVKAMAEAMKTFADQNACELEKIAAGNKEALH